MSKYSVEVRSYLLSIIHARSCYNSHHHHQQCVATEVVRQAHSVTAGWVKNVQMSHENNDFLSSDVCNHHLAVKLSASYSSLRSPVSSRRSSCVEGR